MVNINDGLALVVGSLTQNIDNGLLIRTKSFHGSSSNSRKKTEEILFKTKITNLETLFLNDLVN
jgi:hypothetical protein